MLHRGCQSTAKTHAGRSLAEKIEHLQAEVKALQSENESFKEQSWLRDALGDVMDQVVEVKGVKLLAARLRALT